MQITFGGIIFLLIIALIIGGIFYINHWRKSGRASVSVKGLNLFGRGEKQTGPPPNTWIVRPRSVEVVYKENPVGMKKKYHNDGQYYYVEYQDDRANPVVSKEWALPDLDENSLHFDPAEYGNVKTMECCKKFLEYSPNTFQKIAFGIMALIAGCEMLALVVLA